MSLEPGTRLGRYENGSKIGEGGMGEVYLVEDARLHRKVALKILPADLASNKDRMRHFEQEATSAATLNHPNIAHIYEIDQHDGTNLFEPRWKHAAASVLFFSSSRGPGLRSLLSMRG